MDPFGAGAIGASIGGEIGAIGGYFQGLSSDEAARDLRKKIRQGTMAGQADTVRQVAGVLGSQEYQTADNFIRGLYGMGPVTGEELYNQLLGQYGGMAQSFGQNIGGGYGPQSVSNRDYVQRTLLGGARGNSGAYATNNEGYAYTPDALDAAVQSGRASGPTAGRSARRMQEFNTSFANTANPLLQNYSQSMRQTLSARGLNSGMSAAGFEASGLAAYQTQLQLQQIPTLLNLASAPATYRQQFEGGNISRGVFGASGGQAVYGQAAPGARDQGPMAGILGAFSGAMAGAGAGGSLGINMAGLSNQKLNPRSDELYDYFHPKAR